MKSDERVFGTNTWTVHKFPKRNRAILYNSTTKKYEIHKLRDDKPVICPAFCSTYCFGHTYVLAISLSDNDVIQ